MTALAIFCTILTLGMVTQEVIKNNRQMNQQMKIRMAMPTIIQKSEEILDRVAQRTGIEREQILSKSRKRELVVARQITQWLIAMEYHKSKIPVNHNQIGQVINRDRTGVYHSITTIDNLIKVRDRYVLDILNKYHGYEQEAA